MKTATIKDLLKKEVLIIEWQDDYEIVGRIIFGKSNQKGVLENLFNLDGYTILGKPDEIKEEDAKELVQYLTRRDLTITPKNYSKCKDGRFEDITFTESLLSAIEIEITESFDFKRTLIFVKN